MAGSDLEIFPCTAAVQVLWTCILSKTAADKPQRAVASGNVIVPLCIETADEDPIAAMTGAANAV